ncbi:MAG TPA: hypothetical protein VFE32_02035 [Puia sp.]|nr:hypothetical protein [Puia sp.]
MTKVFFLGGLVFFNSLVIVGTVMGQAEKGRAEKGQAVPMRAENWIFKPGAVEFLQAGQAGGGEGGSMKILKGNGLVTLKGVDFSDGVIEFDLLPAEKQFSSMYFRYKDSLEGECFYFRTDRMGQPQAIQYTPIIGGINCWNLFDNYQTAAEWDPKMPIHTKLVVSGHQMRVYLNHATQPALEVPRLEGNVTHGAICFEGMGTLSNLVVRPGQVEGLPAVEGFDPAADDPHYIRHWQVTEPELVSEHVDFSYSSMPDSQRVWKPVEVERRGLLNLTRLYPPAKNFVRRIVFVRTTLYSDQARTCQLQLGFMNEVWVWLNGQWLYIDKNYFGTPIAKQRGRISIENSTLTVPLEKGDNQLMIGVGGGFYGWGVMARVEELEGITMK